MSERVSLTSSNNHIMRHHSRVVVFHRHCLKIVNIVLIGGPIIITLDSVFIRAIAYCWEESRATLVSFSEEVALFVSVNA